jgi:hypothetical protein
MAISSALGTGSLTAGVCTSSTRPSAPFEGQMIYETDTDRVLVWNNSAWVDPSTGRTEKSGLAFIESRDLTTSSGNTDFTGVVTSSYKNYKIFVNTTAVSTTLAIRMQMLNGATPITGSDYSWYVKGYANDLTGAGETSFMVLQGFSTVPHQASTFDVMNPGVATRTTLGGTHIGTTTGGGLALGHYSGAHGLTTAYTGFRFFPSTGNFTGTISIYGYNQ